MTTRVRIALTAGFGVAIGLWVYAAEEGGNFLDTTAAGVCALALIVIVPAIIRRWWALLIIFGPLVALVYLEVSGFVGTQEEYADRPLLSPPGIFGFLLLGFLMLVGVGLGQALQEMHGQWRERLGRQGPEKP